MIFHWFNAREAEEIASELADQFTPQASGPIAAPNRAGAAKDGSAALQDLLGRVNTDGRLAGLNFYKRARFANSFKWRLLENGIEPGTANSVTHSLIVHLSRGASTRAAPPTMSGSDSTSGSGTFQERLRRGNKAFAEGAYRDALEIYRDLVNLAPDNPEAQNNLGAALCKVGGYLEAEQRFRLAVAANPDYAEAHCNLGTVLRWVGNVEEAELSLRRALKLNPNHVEARTGLGFTLLLLGRLRDAKARFEKVLKATPRRTDALFGMGQIEKLEGRFLRRKPYSSE